MKKIEGIIFDMDGTLFDTERVALEFWRESFKRHGYVLHKDIYTSLMGRKRAKWSELLIKEYGQALPIDKISEEKDAAMFDFINNKGVPVKKGVYELLDFLQKSSYKVALATSTSRIRALKLLNLAKIVDKFDIIVCGDDIVNSKPSPEIFLKAAKELETDPKNCIVIEDSPVGIEAAYKAQMMPINIPDLKEPDSDMKLLSYRIYPNLLDFKDFLENEI
ncbi:HAD family hydrolase [Haloimpatiens sp. FM7315]|uniref:HAD family hydrolase n=1 Tax=Haloimpatiens sp. FM7315 TaxID=3298609 RepID=UPI00370A3F94